MLTAPRLSLQLKGQISRAVRQLFSDRFVLLMAWIGVIVIFSILLPETFATTANVRTILSSQSVLVLLALGLLFPLNAGELDFSVGATLTLSAISMTVLNANHGWPIGLAILIALGIGALIGTVNGFLIVFVGVQALVTTLGIATVVFGIGYAISNYGNVTGVSDKLIGIVSGRLMGVPYSLYYALLLAALIFYFLQFTPSGRHLLFVGRSQEVARLAGLSVNRLRFGAFVAAGLTSALAGIVLTGTLGGADPNAGNSLLIPAYSAVFLGSTTINPGQFNAWGTVVAVYFLVTSTTGLQLLGLEDWVQQVFFGAALVFAVTLSRFARGGLSLRSQI